MPGSFKEGVKALETILHRHDMRKPDPYLAAYAHILHILQHQIPLLLHANESQRVARLLGFVQGAFRAWGWQLDNRPVQLEDIEGELTKAIALLNRNTNREGDARILTEEMPTQAKNLLLPEQKMTRTRGNYLLQNWARMQSMHAARKPRTASYYFGIQQGMFWVLGLATLTELEMITEQTEGPLITH